MINSESSFLLWLQKIRERPGLFLGEPSLTALVHFWNGYAFNRMINGSDANGENSCFVDCDESSVEPEQITLYESHFMDGFEAFVYNHYKSEWTTQGWAKLILEKCITEEEAFYKFFELLDEFFAQND